MDHDLARQVDRMESTEEIRQLASRYALAVDSRNIEDLVQLFVEDVWVSRDNTGREAMREWWKSGLGRLGAGVHFVGTHVIDFDDDDHAHGIVYCHAEREAGAHWIASAYHYWDTYERKQGRWYFVRRKLMTLYSADMLERPVGPMKRRQPGRPRERGEVPAAYPSWERFWRERGVKNPPIG